MLLIIQNVDKFWTFAVDWKTRTVSPGVLNYKGRRSDEAGRWLAQKAEAASSPSDFMDRLGGGWHLVDGFLKGVQSELDLSATTDHPSSATPDQLQELRQTPHT